MDRNDRRQFLEIDLTVRLPKKSKAVPQAILIAKCIRRHLNNVEFTELSLQLDLHAT